MDALILTDLVPLWVAIFMKRRIFCVRDGFVRIFLESAVCG